MKAECLIYRKLTPNEFKAITNTINSVNGGSQTYIDFPKGSISDEDFKDFFLSDGVVNANGFEWTFYVNSLSLGRTQQKEVVSSRRQSSNSLREQNNENRIMAWKPENSGFPSVDYDEKHNPIIVFILRSSDKEYWAGWFYRNQVSDEWPMNKGLSAMLWNDCGYIKFDTLIPFDESNVTWPFLKSKIDKIKMNMLQKMSLQQIYYGAPGTGKSYEINKITCSNNSSTIRTTFHPDSDYSTFVGSYKPIMTKVELRNHDGHVVVDDNNKVVKEPRITYKFVKQAFLKAYLAAWKKYSAGSLDKVEPQFLVIEEINRGNCAQIFGDLFQLLDRSGNGFSSYPIEADADLQAEIENAFSTDVEYKLENDLAIEGVVKNYVSNSGKTLSEDVQSGRVLLLPKNLYIWATMNTSDQSLFPIDSAFKRRWDWKYIKIADAGKGWMIKCGSEACDWWKFVSEINKNIAEETNSDDKKLGYFFCKPDKDDVVVSEEMFVGKVLFYLWNDVFKDGDTSIFKLDTSTGEPSFEDFYTIDEAGATVVSKSALRQFLINIVGEDELIQDFADDDNSESAKKGSPLFRLDGGEPKKMFYVVGDLVKKYADNHAEDSVEQIVESINGECQSMLDKIKGGFIIETEIEHEERCKEKSKEEKPVIVDLGSRGRIFVNRYWSMKNRIPFIEIARKWGNITSE